MKLERVQPVIRFRAVQLPSDLDALTGILGLVWAVVIVRWIGG